MAIPATRALAGEGTGEALPVGAVVGDTFAILRRRWAIFAALALLLLGLPQVLPWAAAILAPDAPGLTAGAVAVSGVLAIVLNVVFYGAVTHAALAAAEGAPGSVRDSLGRGFRLFFGTIVIGIRSGLGILIASLLLVVPGVMLFCAWAVVLPAYVAERDGIGGAFRRSRALTDGHRWRIFGLALVYGLIVVALFLPVLIAGAALAPGRAVATLTVLQNVALDLASLLAEVGYVALYAALRRILDGAPASSLAAAFE